MNGYLGKGGLLFRHGTVVDATNRRGQTSRSSGSQDDLVDCRPTKQLYKARKKSLIGRMRRKIEYAKAQVRAKVEHPFRVITRQFGYTKVRFRGLSKNIAEQTTLFALSNVCMGMGEVRL